MNSLERVGRLIQNHRKAIGLGVWYGLRRWCRIPSEVRDNSKTYRAIHHSSEGGQTTDFIGIFLDDIYYLDLIDPMSIRAVVDVGANIGLFSVAARRCFPEAKIHAYEPNSALMPLLSKNAHTWQFDCRNEAVSMTSGVGRLRLEKDSRMSVLDPCGTVEMRVTAIHDVIDRIGGVVDLLKLDCEGEEWSILEAGISRRVRYLTMEYHCLVRNFDHIQVNRFIENAGFDRLAHAPDRTAGQCLYISRNFVGSTS